jgi:hypothetical protein
MTDRLKAMKLKVLGFAVAALRQAVVGAHPIYHCTACGMSGIDPNPNLPEPRFCLECSGSTVCFQPPK